MKKRIIWLLCTFALMLAASLWLIANLEKSHAANSKELLQNRLEEGVSSYYALYSQYPESLETLKKKYGIYIDTSRYFIRYDIFADNIRPNIEVMEIGDDYGK